MSGTRSGDTDVAVLDDWFAAFNAHDVDALLELAHPDVQVFPLGESASLPPGTTYHGRDGLRTLMTATFERFPQVRIDHQPVLRRGKRITVDLEFVLDDGESQPAIREATCDYQVVDGHVRRVRSYERQRRLDRERSRVAALSPREREVLSMLAGGQTVIEIAGELFLSPLTVRTHVRNAKDKLQARTTAHAVAIALDENALDV